MPSSTLDRGRYFWLASSARSPTLSSTGVVCVWKPVIALGRPACQCAAAQPQQLIDVQEMQLFADQPTSICSHN